MVLSRRYRTLDLLTLDERHFRVLRGHAGRVFRLLNVMDDHNRQVLWIEVDTSLPSLRVIRVHVSQLPGIGGDLVVSMEGPERDPEDKTARFTYASHFSSSLFLYILIQDGGKNG